MNKLCSCFAILDDRGNAIGRFGSLHPRLEHILCMLTSHNARDDGGGELEVTPLAIASMVYLFAVHGAEVVRPGKVLIHRDPILAIAMVHV